MSARSRYHGLLLAGALSGCGGSAREIDDPEARETAEEDSVDFVARTEDGDVVLEPRRTVYYRSGCGAGDRVVKQSESGWVALRDERDDEMRVLGLYYVDDTFVGPLCHAPLCEEIGDCSELSARRYSDFEPLRTYEVSELVRAGSRRSPPIALDDEVFQTCNFLPEDAILEEEAGTFVLPAAPVFETVVPERLGVEVQYHLSPDCSDAPTTTIFLVE